MILIFERIIEVFDGLFDFFLQGGRELFFCAFEERIGVVECLCGFSSKLGFGFFVRDRLRICFFICDRLRICFLCAVRLSGRAFSGVCFFLKGFVFLSHGVLHKR